jgi:hypothetical protein
VVGDFDDDVARGREDVDSGVGVFRVVVDLLVFFKPGICSLLARFNLPQFVQNVPIALNSNLTNPSKGPFSKIRTLSLVFSLPFTVALNAEPSESTASPFVKTPGETEETGTQN